MFFYTVINFFVWKYYLNMLLIGFLAIKNICFNTNIIEIGTFLAILERKNYFMAAILNFQLFSGKKWRDFVVPGSFEFSIVQSPMLQIFMLLSTCARTRHFLLHIGPTKTERKHPETFVGHSRLLHGWQTTFQILARHWPGLGKCPVLLPNHLIIPSHYY